mmetsp:Transcript_91716/g.296790  ORF Transcript_91716/g.296790 Transcript_91716/m.296790 type:complete len:210 (+) Transcript_91716:201-830(+)
MLASPEDSSARWTCTWSSQHSLSRAIASKARLPFTCWSDADAAATSAERNGDCRLMSDNGVLGVNAVTDPTPGSRGLRVCACALDFLRGGVAGAMTVPLPPDFIGLPKGSGAGDITDCGDWESKLLALMLTRRRTRCSICLRHLCTKQRQASCKRKRLKRHSQASRRPRSPRQRLWMTTAACTHLRRRTARTVRRNHRCKRRMRADVRR